MFYLLETPAGLALFNKEADEPILFAKLKYNSTNEAIQTYNDLFNSKLPESFVNFISTNVPQASTINVLNPEITALIAKSLGLNVISIADNTFRKLRNNSFKYFDVSKDNFNILTSKIANKIIDSSHEDLLIIDMISSIEELEKNINNRIMRAREWYSLHFPELNSVSDHTTYLSYVLKIGNRATFIANEEKSDADLVKSNDNSEGVDDQAKSNDNSEGGADQAESNDNLPDEIIYQLKNSMGCAITDDDMDKIKKNIQNIYKDMKYRGSQCYLLKQKVMNSFPNLYNLIGEILTAKMIRKAGSITLLSQCTSSTIQIFGSEKAFNEAIKGQTSTPKYGFIYDSELVTRASDDLKGKVARILANKISLCSRVDSGVKTSLNGSFGSELKVKVEKEIEKFEDRRNKAKKAILQKKKKYISVKDYDSSKDVKSKRY